MFNDALANMFVAINTGITRKWLKVNCKKTNYLFLILSILFKEGFIAGFRINPINPKNIEIILKYFYNNPVFKKIIRISTKSRPVYISNIKLIKKLLYENKNFDGIYILSTNKGMMTHKEAIIKKLGGQIICKIL